MNVKDLTRHLSAEQAPRLQFNAWTSEEAKLLKKYNEIRQSVHYSLCGNFATNLATVYLYSVLKKTVFISR